MLFAAAPVARAQTVDQAPAHIDFVDGRVTLERDGQAEPARAGVPFVAGDRLRTEDGRVEILLPDGSALDVDQYATVDLQSATLVRVTSGRVLLIVVGANNPSAAVRYQIDTPVASATTDGPGEFRIALLSAPSGVETELAVLRGSGLLTTERGTMPVRAGERSLARDNESPMYAQAFNSARFDAFDRWASARRDARTGTAASAQYLPSDLRVYGSSFDRYGAWQYDAAYGTVWYPSVAYDWRPYYDGYWSPLRSYGWTWIGYDPWSWPTHHYGRWGFSQSRWFWIPDRHWSSAWVSWGAAPGYVSWCPLGFDNRPVFALSVNIGNPWTGWVVVPRTHFGGYPTRQWAVGPDRFSRDTPFVVQADAPVPPHAVPRATVGDASTGGAGAVPRSSAVRPQVPIGSAAQAPVSGRQSPTAASQESGAVNRQTAGNGRPVAIPRGDTRIPPGDSRTSAGTPRFSTGGDSRLPTTPGADRRPPPAPDRRFQTPDGSTLTVDRSLPNSERRQQSDTWLKQPLPDTSRAYQRNPGASATPAPPVQFVRPPQTATPGTDAQQSAAPRWQTYSGATGPARNPPPQMTAPANNSPAAAPRWQTYSGARGPARSDQPPQITAPANNSPAAVPGWQTYSGSPAPARSAPAPQWQATPPPQAPPAQQGSRTAPAYRAPASAAPRSEAPPSSGASASPSSGAASRSGSSPRSGGDAQSGGGAGSSSGGGGARVRHPQ